MTTAASIGLEHTMHVIAVLEDKLPVPVLP